MKYEAPKYEITVIESEDIITASSESYEVEENDDGSGNILIDMGSLFN